MTIYNKQGEAVLDAPITSGASSKIELMKEDSVSLSFVLDSYIPFSIGDYVLYNGENYTLFTPYNPTRNNECSYTYSIKFESNVMGWRNISLLYNNETDWSLTSTPSMFLAQVVENIKRKTGDIYTFVIDSSLTNSKAISFSSENVFNSLTTIAEAWETEWWVRGTVIHLSRCVQGEPIVFDSSNVSIPSITEKNEGFATRFYAFGSDRNIVQDNGGVTNHISKKRLSLPLATCPNGYKDIKAGLLPTEIIEKTIVFDSIYPSADLVVSKVREQIKENTEDIKGHDENGEPIYNTYSVFYIEISNTNGTPFEFKEEYEIEGLKLSISFQNGHLGGREFELDYDYKTKEYYIRFDESEGLIIPNTILRPSAGHDNIKGDSIILFNIEMPNDYITSAKTKLEQELDKYIENQKKDKNVYELKSNPVRFFEDNITVLVGSKISYHIDNNVIDTRILSIESKLESEHEKTIRIGEETIYGRLNTIEKEIVEVTQSIELIKALSDIQKDIVNAYGRTQKEINAAMAEYSKMWFFDKSEDTTADKTDVTKWKVKSKKVIVSESEVVAHSLGGVRQEPIPLGGAEYLDDLLDVNVTNAPIGSILYKKSATEWGIIDQASLKPDLSAYVTNTDARLSDSRNAKDVHDWAKLPTKPTYSVSEVTGLQTALDKKANLSEFETHVGDKVKHVTSIERTNWNDAHSKKHEHANKVNLDKVDQDLSTKANVRHNSVVATAEVVAYGLDGVKQSPQASGGTQYLWELEDVKDDVANAPDGSILVKQDGFWQFVDKITIDAGTYSII